MTMGEDIGKEILKLIREDCEKTQGVKHTDSICDCMRKTADALFWIEEVARKTHKDDCFRGPIEDILAVIKDEANICNL